MWMVQTGCKMLIDSLSFRLSLDVLTPKQPDRNLGKLRFRNGYLACVVLPLDARSLICFLLGKWPETLEASMDPASPDKTKAPVVVFCEA